MAGLWGPHPLWGLRGLPTAMGKPSGLLPVRRGQCGRCAMTLGWSGLAVFIITAVLPSHLLLGSLSPLMWALLYKGAPRPFGLKPVWPRTCGGPFPPRPPVSLFTNRATS